MYITVHVSTYIIRKYMYMCRKLPALHGFVSWVLSCSEQHCTWHAKNPIVRRCTDLLVNQRCTDLQGKRACGFRISRICTVQHGGSLFIWIPSGTAYRAQVSMKLPMAAMEPHCTDFHARPLAQICTDLRKFDVARNCTENVQQDP